MTTLILIRHGESNANKENIFAGHIDPDLSNIGVRQAQLTAKYIADNYNVDKIYSSDLQRAYKTALSLAKILNLEIIEDKNLREIYGGKWEGIKFDQLHLTYPEEYSLWKNHIEQAQCVEGESIKQLGDRIMRALTQIAKDNEGKTVAIATHATPVRVAQCLVTTGSLDELRNIPWVSNASITVFEYDENGFKLIEAGIDKFLLELKTVLPQTI